MNRNKDDSVPNDEPTILSLQDTIDLFEKKYGKDWKKDGFLVCVLIWQSTIFVEDHVKEIIPDLFHLSQEYRQKKNHQRKKFTK